MVATLRVVLDQLVAPTEPELAEASRELARALVLASLASRRMLTDSSPSLSASATARLRIRSLVSGPLLFVFMVDNLTL